MIERKLVAKEECLVGGHGFNHLVGERDVTLGTQQRAQVVDRAEAVLPDDRREPAFKQVVLVIFEHDAHAGTDVLLKEAIVLRQDLCAGALHPVPLSLCP